MTYFPRGAVFTVGSVDTTGAAALLLGDANATSVEIADGGVNTDIQGPVTILEGIDVASAGIMNIGVSTATQIVMGSTGVTTSITGPADIAEGTLTGLNVGTAAAVGTVAVEEYGDGYNHVTVLTLTDYVIGPLAGAAAALTLVPPQALYVLPAGGALVEACYISIALTAAGTAVTPEIGLGSVIGDGSANATIGGAGATMEDYHEGFAVADTDTHAVVANGPVGATAGYGTDIALNAATDSKNIFLNCAGTWNANNTGNLTGTGTVVIKWTTMYA